MNPCKPDLLGLVLICFNPNFDSLKQGLGIIRTRITIVKGASSLKLIYKLGHFIVNYFNMDI